MEQIEKLYDSLGLKFDWQRLKNQITEELITGLSLQWENYFSTLA